MAENRKGVLYYNLEDRYNNLSRNIGGKYSEYKELFSPAIGEAYDVFARENHISELSTGDTLNHLYYERFQDALNRDVANPFRVISGEDILNHAASAPAESKLEKVSREFLRGTLKKKMTDNDTRGSSYRHITPYLTDALGLYDYTSGDYDSKWNAYDENGRNTYIDAAFDDNYIVEMPIESFDDIPPYSYIGQVARWLKNELTGGLQWKPYYYGNTYITEMKAGMSILQPYVMLGTTNKFMTDDTFYTAKTRYEKTVYNEATTNSLMNYLNTISQVNTLTGENIQINGTQLNNNNLMGKTNRLYEENVISSLVNRFHTTNLDGQMTSEIQTAVSKYGLSRGRNLLKKNPTSHNRYDNPYCRVWTSHYQYAKYNNTIRPFSESDTFREFQYHIPQRLRPHNGGERLDAYSSLDTKTGKPIIVPKNDDNLKKCMFSIENLAWRGADNALSKYQTGPNGGRIMWFPPYDIKFSEQVNVAWNANQFIGRGEQVYTYANTDRGGQLSFTMLVDHPSIIDEAARSGNMGDAAARKEEIDEAILRFFAGCDVPDLNVKEPEYEDVGKTGNNNKGTKEETPESASSDAKEAQTKTIRFYVFYPNNFSGRDYANAEGGNKEKLRAANNTTDVPLDPVMYLFTGKGVNNKYPVGQTYDTTRDGVYPGYEIKNHGGDSEAEVAYEVGISVNDDTLKGRGLGSGKTWYYLIDEGQRDEKLQEETNYKDSMSFGLNCNGEFLTSNDTSIKKLITGDTSNVYSLGEVYAALVDQSINRALANHARSESINELKELFNGIGEDLYTSIKIEGKGFASKHDDSTDRNSKNQLLIDGRRDTALWWIKQAISKKYGNVQMEETPQGGCVLEELDDKQKNVNTLLAKLARSAEVSITFTYKQNKSTGDNNSKEAPESLNEEKSGTTKELVEIITEDVENATRETISKIAESAKSDVAKKYVDDDETTVNNLLDTAIKNLTAVRGDNATVQNLIKLLFEMWAYEVLGEKGKEEKAEKKYDKAIKYLRNRSDMANQAKINPGSISLTNNNEAEDSRIKREKNDGNYRPQLSSYTYYEKNTDERYGANVDNEYTYFKDIQNTDPLVYNTIMEKVSHFDPAFHSISPEGFNARLTFLQQCTRQGPTYEVTNTSEANGTSRPHPGNLAFGRAPYCILRIGDFYNTKICIDSVNIDYDTQQWDLNLEGIGVQPMIAKVNIGFKFIGGSDLGGPIERLQNAVSFNYYANASSYDRRADYYNAEQKDKSKDERTFILGDKISNND